jgi:hypothetical protein
MLMMLVGACGAAPGEDAGDDAAEDTAQTTEARADNPNPCSTAAIVLYDQPGFTGNKLCLKGAATTVELGTQPYLLCGSLLGHPLCRWSNWAGRVRSFQSNINYGFLDVKNGCAEYFGPRENQANVSACVAQANEVELNYIIN